MKYILLAIVQAVLPKFSTNRNDFADIYGIRLIHWPFEGSELQISILKS